MEKQELIRQVSNLTGYYQVDVQRILDATITLVKNEVAAGGGVKFPKFGVFEPKKRNARIGRNPHTGEAVPIPARTLPSFKPSLEFKKMMGGRNGK